MKEIKVEEYLKTLVEAADGLCEKHTAPGRIGVPDRLITWPWGEMDLVETKAPDKRARGTQLLDHKARAKRRVPVYLLDTKEKVERYVGVRRNRDHVPGLFSVPAELPGPATEPWRYHGYRRYD